MRYSILFATTCAFAAAEQSLFKNFFASTLEAENIALDFKSTLPCAGCIRSGFDFCSSNATCMEKASDELLCSNAYEDKYNYLYSYCKNVGTCEKPGKFLILDTNVKEDMDVSGLRVGEGCTYRMYTPCGFPRLNVTIANADPNDFNIMYSYAEWNDTQDLDPLFYKKDFFTPENAKSISGGDANMKYSVFKKGIDSDAFANCNGTTRNMYVTITRTKATDITLLAESRMLQVGQERVNLIFDVYEGENSSVRLAASLLIGVAMAFLSLAF